MLYRIHIFWIIFTAISVSYASDVRIAFVHINGKEISIQMDDTQYTESKFVNVLQKSNEVFRNRYSTMNLIFDGKVPLEKALNIVDICSKARFGTLTMYLSQDKISDNLDFTQVAPKLRQLWLFSGEKMNKP